MGMVVIIAFVGAWGVASWVVFWALIRGYRQ